MASNSADLPAAKCRLFFVGIGGIGMSALAQLMRWLGYDVAGSDRGMAELGKAELYAKLKQQGIRLYPQDGSGVTAESPQALIVSTAVEEGNPDLMVLPQLPRVHRARALAQALKMIPDAQLIAVAGSCGKTSVTGWIGSALHALGEPVLVVNGGYYSAAPESLPGNFYADASPRWLVAEIDESDKSIAEFSPDYGVVLNVGNDHYGEEELLQVFAQFLGRCRQGATTLSSLKQLLPSDLAKVALFDGSTPAPQMIHPESYTSDASGITFSVPGFGNVTSGQAGRHSACNGCAVLALLSLLELSFTPQQLCDSLSAFQGIRQRFEYIGKTPSGIPVINDYAHNPEKISAALRTAHEHFGNHLLAVFQPHGFRPLEFMRQELTRDIADLEKETNDTLILLPVFYAGGTASFSPTSDDIANDLADAGIHASAGTREQVESLLASGRFSCLLVMGARDSSLREWCKYLTNDR